MLLPRRTAKYVKPPRQPPTRPSPPPLPPGVRLPDNVNWWLVASDATSQVLAVTAGRPFKPGNVFVSRNGGRSWFNCTSLGAWQWTGLSISGDGSLLVAAAWHRAIFTSPDGLTWTARDSGSRIWQETAISFNGTRLAAVEWGGMLYTSSDRVMQCCYRTGAKCCHVWFQPQPQPSATWFDLPMPLCREEHGPRTPPWATAVGRQWPLPAAAGELPLVITMAGFMSAMTT